MIKIAYLGFTGPIETSSVTRICSALNFAVNNQFNSIHLCFSSLGGYTADGIFLYNHIRGLPIPTTIHATGNVASIAVAVLLGAERRLCSKHVLFMIHPNVVPGSAEGMSWERLSALQNSALAEDNRVEGILRERAALTEDLLAARRSRDVHFSTQDAIKFGIVHGIEEFTLPPGCEVYQI